MKKVVPTNALLIPPGAQQTYKGVIFEAYNWPQVMLDGSEQTFEMLKRPDTVVAVCIVEDKIIVLDEEQPHSGLRKSFPGGQVDKTDDTTLEAVKREVKEESGYSFRNWKLILVKQPYNKIEWFIHFYVASGVDKIQNIATDPGEKTIVNLVTFDELRDKIYDREGYLGEDRDIFAGVEDIDDLLKIKEFSGQLIDR